MSEADPLLDWAADVVGVQQFDAVESLAGGSASRVLRLGATTDAGAVEVVAKQLRTGLPATDEDLVAREASVLDALRPLDLPVPETLACDPRGICTGRPAMLMSAMPGALLQGPDAVRAAIPEYVRALLAFQRRARDLVAGRRFAPWFDSEDPEPRSGTARPDLWERARAVVERFPRPVADGFIHRDPHPANMLFEDGRLSALLDWPNAGRGPRGVDLSRMALNLACLLDVAATTELRERWERASGAHHDPLLDVYVLLEADPPMGDGHATWDALGVPVDRDTLVERLDAFLEDALRRMTVRRLK